MLQSTLLVSTLLLIGSAAAQLAPPPRGSVDLVAARARQRLRALQVQANDLRHAKPRNARRGGQSPIPEPPCKYCGENPGTGECKKNGGGSDGCIDTCYSISPTTLTLASARNFMDNDDFNFQYIPYDQYKGVGSYLNKQPGWTVQSANVHFESRNNQPSGAYIGQGSINWNALTNLPSSGYCILWVQVHNCNQHYGEGGQGVTCYAPGYTPSTGTGNDGGNTGNTGTGSTGNTGNTGTGNTGTIGGTGNTGSSGPKVDAGGVCDTKGWTQQKPCRDGYACVGNEWQKNCQSRNDFLCNRQYDKCGGRDYTGPTCCPESGWVCQFSNEYYSQCVPTPYSP